MGEGIVPQHLDLVSGQQQVHSVLGPAHDHSGQLSILAVQVLVPRLSVLLALAREALDGAHPSAAPLPAPPAPGLVPPELSRPEGQEDQQRDHPHPAVKWAGTVTALAACF